MTKRLSFESYEQWAKSIKPVVQAALAGERDVPPQKPFIEAWLGDALYSLDIYSQGKLVYLEEVNGSADAINHGIPNADEIAWAFLCLRNRGWLEVQGDMYGLTAEGRHAINTIVVQDDLELLLNWMRTHPPSGRVTAREVFLGLGKKSKVRQK